MSNFRNDMLWYTVLLLNALLSIGIALEFGFLYGILNMCLTPVALLILFVVFKKLWSLLFPSRKP